MPKALKIEIVVDDKGSVVMKQFGGNAEKSLGKVKTHAKAGAAQAGKMERAWEKSMSHMKAHWKGYALAGGAALAATAYAIKRFADASKEEFKKFNTAVTDMGKITDESAESIKSKIGSIGPKYGDATELTKAYYNVISAGVTEPVAAMDTLKESVKAAKAAHIESADTVTGITALMEAYGDKIKGASESADLLFQIEASGKTTVKELIPYIGELAGKSAALGISQDELGASFAQVTLLSGSTSNAATQYKAILTSLMAPSKDMTELLAGYGGAQKAIADMGFEGVLKLIAEESGGNAAALQKLMGSAEAVGGTLTLLGNDMEGYNQRLDDMKDKTGLAEKAFSDWEKSMEGIESTYDATVKNIMIAFGKEIAPMVASSMQMIIDMGPTIISTIHTAFDFVQVSYISLVDQVMRGLIDIEYAFKTMVAGIEGAWNSGIDVLEEGFADFLDAVAAGLDKIPFFSDNATASMRELANEVRANTSESEGFVASTMKVQKEKEKELKAHDKIIDAMMAEALGYKKTAAAAIKTEKKIIKSLKNIGKVQAKATKAEIKAAKDTAKAAAKLAKDKARAVTEFSKKYQKLTLGDHKYAVEQLEAQARAYKVAGADHLEVEKWVSTEIGKLVSKEAEAASRLAEDKVRLTEYYRAESTRSHGELAASISNMTQAEVTEALKAAADKAKAAADYAKESTKIYERMYDDVQKLDLGDYAYSLQLLDKRYANYKDHLESLAGQDSKYADGVMLLDKWMAGEKEKLHDDWAKKHGTVLDRMEVRWRDYQKEGIDANRVMYDAISAGAAEMEKQLSDNFFNIMTGNMDKVKFDWDAMWKSMVKSTADHMAHIVAETALDTAAKAAGAGIDWLGGALGWWAAGSWEIKKQHMAMLHPGEMVIPADMAEKVRASSGGKSNIGLGEPMAPEASITKPGSLRDVYIDQKIKDSFKSSLIGYGAGQGVGLIAGLPVGVNPLGVIASFGKAIYEGIRGLFKGKSDYKSVYGEDAQTDWNKPMIDMVADNYAYNHATDFSHLTGWASVADQNLNRDIFKATGMNLAVNAPGTGYSRGSGGGWGGGPGSSSSRGSTGAGEGGSVSGYSGSRSRGGAGPNSPRRYGGLARGPASGYPMELHGNEEVVPLDEPYLSKFRNAVGADPDKIAAAIANKIGSRSGGANNVNITIQADVITTDDVDNWLADRIRRLKDYKVGDEYQTVNIMTAGLET